MVVIMICSVYNCNKEKYGRTWCKAHYERQRRHGVLLEDKPVGKGGYWYKHGHSRIGSLAYRSWTHAKNRVFNPKNDRYYSYGGRGITMCKEWADSFEQFYEDMGERPLGKSLDRIDNNGNYEPGNCRWATPSQQVNNRRTSRLPNGKFAGW